MALPLFKTLKQQNSNKYDIKVSILNCKQIHLTIVRQMYMRKFIKPNCLYGGNLVASRENLQMCPGKYFRINEVSGILCLTWDGDLGKAAVCSSS